MDATHDRRIRWDVDVVLATGLTARVRQIEPDDADAIVRFHDGLSANSRQMRYFTPMPHLSEVMLHRFVNVDHVDREALIVQAGDEIVGLGQYERLRPHPTDAEVAFAVADALHGNGIGTLLLEHLASLARRQGIERFVAETLGTNEPMLHVFARAGFAVHRTFNDGVYQLEFGIAPTTESERLRSDREHHATVASITRLLHPRTIAVQVATGAPGVEVSTDFRGRVTRTDEVEDGTDVVVLDLPAARIADAGWRWADARAGVFVVMSGGTGDDGTGGPLLVRQLVRSARRHGMRVLGPDAYGIVNTEPSVQLRLLRDPHHVLPGRVGVFADGPTASKLLLDGMHARGIGISTFVGAGDKADISANDLLEYWEVDDATDVILLAFGTFGNPSRFAALARRVSQTKPIVIVTPPSPLVDALCRRTGVVRADSLDEVAELAGLLADRRRWSASAPADVPVPDGLDADDVRRLAREALARDHGGRPLDDAETTALLAAAGLPLPIHPGGWVPTVTVCTGRDPRFGATVEVITEPDAPLRIALTPLTSPDLHSLTYGHPAIADIVTRAGTVADLATELVTLRLVVTDTTTPQVIEARAAVAAPTGLIHRARHLN